MTPLQKKLLTFAAKMALGQLGVDLAEDAAAKEQTGKEPTARSRKSKATIAAALGGSLFLVGKMIVAVRTKIEDSARSLREVEDKVHNLDEVIGSTFDRVGRLEKRIDALEKSLGHLGNGVARVAHDAGTGPDITDPPMGERERKDA